MGDSDSLEGQLVVHPGATPQTLCRGSKPTHEPLRLEALEHGIETPLGGRNSVGDRGQAFDQLEATGGPPA